MRRRCFLLVTVLCFALALPGCGSFQRSSDAAAAKRRMIGLSKEQVLICMGPPKQKAHVESTEVWAYASTNGHSDSFGNTYKSSPYTFSYGTREKSFCTVNVVMHDDRVVAVHYNGPHGGLLAQDEQCGYAIEHCVEND